jgi:2-methylisocitrate lyase-like PEP mutase family enzyme
MRGQAEEIANLNTDIPLIADADTGYGGMSISRSATFSTDTYHLE